MKDKLVKNHYKGIDKKMRIMAIISTTLLFVAICVFVPLTANLQYQNVQANREDNSQNPVIENNDQSSLIYFDED
ncbi:MAG: hypothetical protein PHW22_00910 [Bacilli bacterium]|nr:hypothetical protein [Bacilli bacterium]